MGSKGNNRHIKKLAASKYLGISRKGSTFVAKPGPGRHAGDSSIALITVVREKLDAAENAKEARMIIKSGKIKVNGKLVKEDKYPVGFGDILDITTTGEAYKVGIGRRGVVKVDKAKGDERLLKVVGKYLAKGRKLMIRAHDGTIMPSSADAKVNDSVLVKGGKIGKVLPFKAGSKCMIINGIHASETGTIKNIKPGSASRNATVEIEGGEGAFETLVDNVIVTGA